MSQLVTLLYYRCCAVCSCGFRNDKCWVCGLERGEPYYNVFSSFNPGTYMKMSEVKLEHLKWAHP